MSIPMLAGSPCCRECRKCAKKDGFAELCAGCLRRRDICYYDHQKHERRPTFNHTRGDSPLYPCEVCQNLLDHLALMQSTNGAGI